LLLLLLCCARCVQRDMLNAQLKLQQLDQDMKKARTDCESWMSNA
jgi:hypothetical protein